MNIFRTFINFMKGRFICLQRKCSWVIFGNKIYTLGSKVMNVKKLKFQLLKKILIILQNIYFRNYIKNI